MAKYVLVYKGGGMPESEADQKAAMDAWMSWFGGLGDAVIDGGNPFGPSVTVSPDGSSSDGTSSGVSGYSILNAESLSAAAGLAKGCPILAVDGKVEVFEALDM